MDSKWKSKVLALLLASVSCSAAQAQSTLGEILDKGAHQLGREELRNTLSGATFFSTGASGRIDVSVSADGRVGGNVQGPAYSTNFIGTWRITDDEKFCFAYTPNSVGATQRTSCAYYFQLGDEYFVSQSKSDPAAPVTPRQIRH